MRIAYLGSKGLPSKSGTERVVEAIVTRLSHTHTVTVYCDARYTPRGTEVEGVRLVRIPTLGGKYTRPVSLFLLSALHALFSRYDLIHLHGTDACFTLPLLRLRYRVVATAHGVPGRIPRLKWNRAARFLIRLMELPFVHLSNCPTSVSCPDADYLKARYHRDVRYIPNGVDNVIRFDQEKAGRKLAEAGLPPGEFLMFAAGRIDPTKGCHLVLEALNHMGNPRKLAVVGDLNQAPSYSEQLRQMADKQQVLFFPPIADRELLFGMLRQARLFLFPSTCEGMSMMLLEAASLDVPIICSDILENQLVMQDHVLYFRSEDTADLQSKIEWALEHSEEMSKLARDASTHISNTLTWEKIVGQYEEVYAACGKKAR
jgi:glycosyltransferase involved in cell wall biosynthesis